MDMSEQTIAESVTQIDIDQRVYDLYDEYCHGKIDRREFLRAAALIAGGLAMARALLPRYALAQTISFTDPRVKAQYVNYPSPGGNSGDMRGYLVQPSGAGPFPVVLVVHENRKGFSRWHPTASFRSAAIRATMTTAARCRRSSTRRSFAPTC